VNDSRTAAGSSRLRVWVALTGAALLVIAVAGYVWRPKSTRDVPPLPAQIQDEEIKEYLSQIRGKTEQNRGSAEAWGELGLAYLANLLDRDADVCLAEAARLDPGDVRWPYVRAIIASKRDPVNTVALLRQAAAAARPGPKHRSVAKLFLAETLLEQGEFDEAERLFREESANRDSQPRATLGLGLLARARGEDAAATELLTQAREHPSSRIQATIQLAALARARGDISDAEALEKETALLPDDRPWSDPLLAELSPHKVGRRARERTTAELQQAGDFAGAARAYLKQIDERPTAEAYLGAAVNLARLQDYDMAQQLLTKAVELEPDSSKIHYTIALVNFTRAEKERAANPGSAAAIPWFRQAVTSGKRATELKPDHAQAYLMWGLALQHLDEPAAAIEPLRKGVACRPDSFDLQLSLGQALLESGQQSEAKEALTNAQRLRSSDPRPVKLLEEIRDQRP
jgi:tetratricopeptide (TPR) repeat protein